MVLVMIGIYGYANYIEHNYTREDCRVVYINEEGVATIEDKQGWLWKSDRPDLKVGDIVDLKMYDPYLTSKVSDDIIKKIIIK